MAAVAPLGSATTALRGRPRVLAVKPSDAEAVANPAAAFKPSGVSSARANEATRVVPARPSVMLSPTSSLTTSEF